MRNLSLKLILMVCVVVGLAGAASSIPLSVGAQQPDPTASWLAVVNQARLNEGLAPYSLSTLLTAAAQRHANDLAQSARVQDLHLGSDGSTPSQRISEAGYAAWTREGGELVIGENVWIGSIEEGIPVFLADPLSRDNLLSTVYREIGIGSAAGADGRGYHVLVFGARPNVLPIFINDGALSTDDPQVAIRLTNEEARPRGEGAIFMGQAIEVRISNEPNFEGLPWQSWSPLLPWTLPSVPGEYTVYVQFRDAGGRTAASPDTIFLSAPGEQVIVTPTPWPSIPAPGPTTAPDLPTPESGEAATPTPQVGTPLVPLPPTLDVPTAPPIAAVGTPFPTWTPLPTATVAPAESSDLLPPWLATLRELAVPLLVALQTVVILLALYLVLRRGSVDD
ncbi:MAG TPA: hypothetical protein ENN99_06850 [Chloroflexi bacterium]|nr:hypothetical protein [Chloroflexota bacterium]